MQLINIKEIKNLVDKFDYSDEWYEEFTNKFMDILIDNPITLDELFEILDQINSGKFNDFLVYDEIDISNIDKIIKTENRAYTLLLFRRYIYNDRNYMIENSEVLEELASYLAFNRPDVFKEEIDRMKENDGYIEDHFQNYLDCLKL